MSPAAAQWLVDERVVHGVAIDTASIDYGQSKQFLVHRIFAKKNIYNVENVNTKNLDLLESDRPFLIVTPLKISTGSGSPVRPILLSRLPYASAYENPKLPSLISLFLLVGLLRKCCDF